MAYKRERHGHSHTRFYYVYKSMMNRCYRPEVNGYGNYGGRGITVDARWHSFSNFRDDMYESYLRHLAEHVTTSLERVDNDAPYSASNCRWATRSEQALNRRPPILPRRRRLTPKQVVNILHCRGAISSQDLGHLYGVSQSTVSDVWTRKTWNPLPVREELYR